MEGLFVELQWEEALLWYCRFGFLLCFKALLVCQVFCLAGKTTGDTELTFSVEDFVCFDCLFFFSVTSFCLHERHYWFWLKSVPKA